MIKISKRIISTLLISVHNSKESSQWRDSHSELLPHATRTSERNSVTNKCMAQSLANQVAVEDHNIVHSQLQPLLSPAMLSCSHNAIVSFLWNCYLGAAGGGFPVDDDLCVVHAVALLRLLVPQSCQICNRLSLAWTSRQGVSL